VFARSIDQPLGDGVPLAGCQRESGNRCICDTGSRGGDAPTVNDASDVDGQPARTVSDARVARSARHLIGWSDDVDRFLAMVAHVLERSGSTVTRDDGITTLTVDPTNRHLGVCASSTVTVPVGDERVLEVAVTDASTAAVDRDKITFACHP